MRKLGRKIFLMMAALVIFQGAALADGGGTLPFSEGEKITFLIKWWVFPAGEAVLEVMPTTTIDGVPARHFVMTAKTNSFADAFYKVRDRVEGFTDMGMTKSLFYKKKQREGSTEHDVEVRFDWADNQAVFTEDGKRHAPIRIEEGTFDPLSVLYRARMLPLAKGKEFSLPVTDGKKLVIGQGQVTKEKKIHIPAGKFKALEFAPDLKHIGGVFKESEDARMRLWFSDDAKRLLLKMKSKVAVGHFSAEMISVSHD